MSKLWRVNVEVEVYVVADDHQDAETLAEEHAANEIDQGNTFVNATEIKDRKRIPAEWADAIPYGGDGETTCEAFLRARPTPPTEGDE